MTVHYFERLSEFAVLQRKIEAQCELDFDASSKIFVFEKAKSKVE